MDCHRLPWAAVRRPSRSQVTDADRDSTGEVPTRYVGEWNGGRRVGHGSQSYLSGASYVGDFDSEERFDGEGTHHAADGARYHGEWAAGEYHGTGRLELPDGTEYDGEWTHGKRTGVGRLQLPSGDVWQGTLVDGAMVSHGTMTYGGGLPHPAFPGA